MLLLYAIEWTGDRRIPIGCLAPAAVPTFSDAIQESASAQA